MSLEAVLLHYGVQFKRGRLNQKVKCPIHGERDPSMSVSLDKGAFKCHSCGAAGGQLQFIMGMEGISRPEAIAFAKENDLFSDEGLPEEEDRPGWAAASTSGKKPNPKAYTPPWMRK